jgi:hypothetical protein
MPNYEILASDGQGYGPLTAEAVRQWIEQNRITAATPAKVEGAPDWKPLGSFPEFSDALAPPQSPPPTGIGAPVVAAPSGPARMSGLAIASLVCGLLGFLFVPAVAGLVLGIIALSKIAQSKGQLQGRGLAIAGICLAGLMILLSMAAIPAALLLPALARAKAKAQQINCVANLKQVGLATRIYSNDHKGVFPPDFPSMANELGTPRILVCPADQHHRAALNWNEFDPGRNLSYDFLKPGITEDAATPQVIFRCPVHGNVVMGDGSVQMDRRR